MLNKVETGNFNAKAQRNKRNLASPRFLSNSVKEIYYRGRREHRVREGINFFCSSVISVVESRIQSSRWVNAE